MQVALLTRAVRWMVLAALMPLTPCLIPRGNAASPDEAVVDSAMTREEALRGVDPECPSELLRRLELLDVSYYSFDGKLHRGQLLVDGRLAAELREVFDLIRVQKFPLTSVIPVADPQFGWNDARSMAADNSSGFNYRRKTDVPGLSAHAYGRAVDINPARNPYVTSTRTLPEGASYEPARPGTLTANHPVVEKFTSLGWTWGGNWQSPKDYQHFEKK